MEPSRENSANRPPVNRGAASLGRPPAGRAARSGRASGPPVKRRKIGGWEERAPSKDEALEPQVSEDQWRRFCRYCLEHDVAFVGTYSHPKNADSTFLFCLREGAPHEVFVFRGNSMSFSICISLHYRNGLVGSHLAFTVSVAAALQQYADRVELASSLPLWLAPYLPTVLHSTVAGYAAHHGLLGAQLLPSGNAVHVATILRLIWNKNFKQRLSVEKDFLPADIVAACQ